MSSFDHKTGHVNCTPSGKHKTVEYKDEILLYVSDESDKVVIKSKKNFIRGLNITVVSRIWF